MKKLTVAAALLATFTLTSCDPLMDIIKTIGEMIINAEGSPLCGVYDPYAYDEEGPYGDGFIVYDLREATKFTMVWADKTEADSKAQNLWGLKTGEYYMACPPDRYTMLGYSSEENPGIGVMCFGDMTTWLYKTDKDSDLTIWDNPQEDESRYPKAEEAKGFIKEVLTTGKFHDKKSLKLKRLPDVPAHVKLYEKNMACLSSRVCGYEYFGYFPIPFIDGSYAINSYSFNFGTKDKTVSYFVSMDSDLKGKMLNLNDFAKTYPGKSLVITILYRNPDGSWTKSFEYKSGEITICDEDFKEWLADDNYYVKLSTKGDDVVTFEAHTSLAQEGEATFGSFDVNLVDVKLVPEIN